MAEDTDSARAAALRKAIARIVADTKESGAILRSGYHAGMLASDHPGYSIGRIIDELLLEATREGVPLEISRPDDT